MLLKLQKKSSNDFTLNDSLNTLLKAGKILPVLEEFYSIQGEGFNTGRAAYFIRVGGCDVGCRWCDAKETWNANQISPVPIKIIVEHAASNPSRAIVVTGGEPLQYNLDLLCEKLKQNKIIRFLETSGSLPFSGSWDWICLSPKKESPPLPEAFKVANEMKVIIYHTDDFSWAEENKKKVDKNVNLYLQPEWSRRKIIIPEIIRYVKQNPIWKISLQSHKYMHIP